MRLFIIITIALAFFLNGCSGSKSSTQELKEKTGWFRVLNIDSTSFIFYNSIPLIDEDNDTSFVFISKAEMKSIPYTQLEVGKSYKLHLQEYLLQSFTGNDSLSLPGGTSMVIGYKNNAISELYKIVQIIETK